MKKTLDKNNNNYFIDLFSGCGGLSLGLSQAGWKGLFAIEKDPMAFETLEHNLIDKRKAFHWPDWLEREAMPVSRLLTKHKENLEKLKGKVELIAGGPPCQGFSLAGRRDKNDPRNKLTGEYLKVVKAISPRYLLLENVRGFDAAFVDADGKRARKSYAQYVMQKLESLGYKVFSEHIKSRDFGVPQMRTRFIMIAIKTDRKECSSIDDIEPFRKLYDLRVNYLNSKGLNPDRPVTVKEAISDLKVSGKKLIPSLDSPVTGFNQIEYKLPANLASYKKLMRKGMINGATPSDLRLPRHQGSTVIKFKKILKICEKGRCISPSNRKRLRMKKHATTPLDGDKPAATVTTLPDDILHYSEPRILTVRENARLQSFPDWFSFRGKYTTGGAMRTKECPRYSQVGNAVPPLLAEALGCLFIKLRK